MAQNAKLTVAQAFARLSDGLSGYEERPQQLELATSIERAFSVGKTGIFEAGTGTGKSLAALIPAVLSGKKVVVSTATISLQEQYIHKDIPLLNKNLPIPFDAVLLKGRGNYLGLRRYQDFMAEQTVDDYLNNWVETTYTGDVSELDFVPGLETWLEINSDSDDCLRQRCPQFNDCFYFEARRRAESADILVVNHALLLADAASRGSVLPEYELLIIDEAHQLPDIATDAFSHTMSNRGIRSLATKALKRIYAPPRMVHDIEREAGELFMWLMDLCVTAKTRIRQAVPQVAHLKKALSIFQEWLEEESFEHVPDDGMAREKVKLKAKGLLATTESYIRTLSLLEEPSASWIVSVERSDFQGSRMEIVAAPLDIAPFIQDLVLEKPGMESSVWMSATLATGGDDPFSFFKKTVGIEGGVIQSKVNSPFDYERQSVLYLPKYLPEPNSQDFLKCIEDEIARLLEISEGRAFVLFTSRYAMSTTYDALKNSLPFECKRQGELPRLKLIEWFRETPNAVLFGTSSFWEGVSVDGDQLSCVIIDRIPFQVPDDPVYEARCERLKENPEASWFNDLALPHATMRLKQGVGRLIRTATDKGVVAILDTRLTKKYYGRRIIECLPPMRVVRELKAIADFMWEDGMNFDPASFEPRRVREPQTPYDTQYDAPFEPPGYSKSRRGGKSSKSMEQSTQPPQAPVVPPPPPEPQVVQQSLFPDGFFGSGSI